MKKKILYIEDEPSLGKVVYETLLNQNFDVLLIPDGAEVMESFETFIPDICVVDIMLPNIDGLTLCKQIKNRFPKMPVIFLTAKVETDDLVKGFEAGGTDYMRKPFSVEELILRINNQLKLTSNRKPTQDPNEERKIGNYIYYPIRYEIKSPSKMIKLSQRDKEVLDYFTNNINKAIERKEMLQKIWGDDSYFNSRTLDVYIRKLREHLSEDKNIEIVTLKGKGYLFLVK